MSSYSMISNQESKNEDQAVRMRSRMAKQQRDRKWLDVTIIAGDDGQRISAHRIVLASSSDYFDALFSCGLQESMQSEVTLDEVHGDQLIPLINYCYSGEIEINADNVEDLMATASMLQFDDVLKMCGDFLLTQLDPSNCLGFNALGTFYSCMQLSYQTQEYIWENFEEVYQTEEFLQLDARNVCEILCSQKLNVRSEETVFKSLLAWIRFDRRKRDSYFRRLFYSVRYSLLSVDFIEKYVEPVCCSYKCEHVLKWSFGKSAFRLPRQGNTGLLALFCGSSAECITLEWYSEANDCWRRFADIPKSRYVFASVVFGEELLIIGGSTIDDLLVLNTVECFNLRTQQSEMLAPMPSKRHGLCAAVLYGLVYAVGGITSHVPLKTVERYDPATNRWSFVAPLLVEKLGASAAALAGKLYVVGGTDTICVHTATTQMYDPDTNRWTLKAPMNHGRRNFGLSSHKGHLYAVGGFLSYCAHIVERYDPQADVWLALYSLVTMPCLAFNAFLSGDRLKTVITEIKDGKSLLSVEEFNTQSAEFKIGRDRQEDFREVMHFGLCNVFQMP